MIKKALLVLVFTITCSISLFAADGCASLTGKKAYFCYRYPQFNTAGSWHIMDLSQVTRVEWIRESSPCTFKFHNGETKGFDPCGDSIIKFNYYWEFIKNNPELIPIQ